MTATADPIKSLQAMHAGMHKLRGQVDGFAAMLNAAAIRWVASGEAGNALDSFVAMLVNGGHAVEVIQAGTKYRFDGDKAACDALVTPLDKRADAAVIVEREMPPATSITVSTSVQPARPYRRTFIVHGSHDACAFVARAIDRGLAVSTVGVNRFAVTGRTADLLAWSAAVVHRTSVEEVMKTFGITAAMVADEDGAQSAVPVNVVSFPPVSVVSLPARKTVTAVDRDRDGNIVETTQRETNA